MSIFYISQKFKLEREINIHSSYPEYIEQIVTLFENEEDHFSRFSAKADICEQQVSQVLDGIGNELQRFGGQLTLKKYIDLNEPVTIKFFNQNGNSFKTFDAKQETGIVIDKDEPNRITISVPLLRRFNPKSISVTYTPDFARGGSL